MILEDDFSYTDKDGKVWLAPKGAEINGATIPKILWSTVGSPFVGVYRRASVVHDYFVGEGNNPDVSYQERREADKMFYRACRTDGCSWKFAAVLYVGVSVGTWSSQAQFEHSRIDDEFETLLVEDDKIVESKYLNLRSKVQELVSGEENFEALEKLVEEEISR